MNKQRRMTMDKQVISPRAFALGGFLIIAMLAYASCSFGAECASHCSEERIEALEAQNAAKARPVIAPKVVPTVEATTRALGAAIRSTGYVCDDPRLLSRTDDLPGPVAHLTRFNVICMTQGPEGYVRFTVDVTTRIVVYAGAL